MTGGTAGVDVSKSILNCVESAGKERDWLVDAARAAGIHPPSKEIPPNKGPREDFGWPVGNQRATGSCLGWGTADGVLRWHFVMKERITREQSLSVRYLWIGAKETDEFTSRPTTFIEKDGTSLKAALNIPRGALYRPRRPYSRTIHRTQ